MSANEELAALQRDWKAPSELRAMGPREVRLKAGGVALVCLATLLLIGAIVAATALSRVRARQASQNAVLRAAGLEVQATVTRHWRSGDKSDTPRIAYQFQYGGKTYDGSSDAPGKIWRTLAVGSPIAVRLVPTRPELNHPAEWEGHVMPKFVPGLVAGMLVGPGLMIFYSIRRLTSLLSEGRPALARVTGYSRSQHGKIVKYEFATLSGEVAKGRSGPRHKPPPVGSTLCILYDRDNPKRNAPYPIDLVQVDR
jgi:hypothetical protein